MTRRLKPATTKMCVFLMVVCKEKKHRLNESEYCGLIRASFTCCICNYQPAFVNSNVVDSIVGILSDSCKKHACINWAYVFMPDHIHIVLEGVNDNSNLWKTVVLFKQKTGYWFSQNDPTIRWQKDFYDHIHRSEDELINHILYVVYNPVRKGLVKNWKEYPFKGSLHNDLNAIVF